MLSDLFTVAEVADILGCDLESAGVLLSGEAWFSPDEVIQLAEGKDLKELTVEYLRKGWKFTIGIERL